jgi:hypothetical protein
MSVPVRIRSVFTRPLTPEEITAGFDSNVNVIVDVHYRNDYCDVPIKLDLDGRSYQLSKEGGTFSIEYINIIKRDVNIKVYTGDRTISSGRYFPVKFADGTFIDKSHDYVLIQLEKFPLFVLVSSKYIFNEIKDTTEPGDMFSKNTPFMQTVFKYRDEFLKICSPE